MTESVRMPIRATPYRHQQEAFEFALRLFGELPPVEEKADAKEVMPMTNELQMRSSGCAILADMGVG